MDPRPTSTPLENLPQSSHTQERQQITTDEKKPQLYPISKERGPRTTENLEPQLATTSKQPSKQEDGERQQSSLPKKLFPSLGIFGILCDYTMPKKTDEVTFSAFVCYISLYDFVCTLYNNYTGASVILTLTLLTLYPCRIKLDLRCLMTPPLLL